MAEHHARRAEAVRARHQVLASVQGSGWHQADPDERDRVARGQVPLAERPIAVADGDKIYLSGSSAVAFREGLTKFLEECGETEYGTAISAQAKVCCVEVLAEEFTGELCLAKNVWNACLYGLTEIGMNIVLTSLKPSKGE